MTKEEKLRCYRTAAARYIAHCLGFELNSYMEGEPDSPDRFEVFTLHQRVFHREAFRGPLDELEWFLADGWVGLPHSQRWTGLHYQLKSRTAWPTT